MENLRKIRDVSYHNNKNTKQSSKEYFSRINKKQTIESNEANKGSSLSRNNNFISKSVSRNNNFFLPSGKTQDPKNLTSNDIIAISSNALYDNLKYTGYRFDDVKNIAEIVELNGTFKRKVPSVNSEIYNTFNTGQKASLSPWKKIMAKTPKDYKPQIKMADTHKKEISIGNRVLFPDKDVRFILFQANSCLCLT